MSLCGVGVVGSIDGVNVACNADIQYPTLMVFSFCRFSVTPEVKAHVRSLCCIGENRWRSYYAELQVCFLLHMSYALIAEATAKARLAA